jgi:hypothetical protein
MNNKKKTPKPLKVPKPVSAERISEHLNAFDETPAEFWSSVESTWDWVALRRGGKLTERVKALDAHFNSLSKTNKICPIVLLLNRGPKE